MADGHLKKVAPKYDEINLRNIATQRTYMKAIMELSPKSARIFPDANSTLRVTYGKIKGYKPNDGVIFDSKDRSYSFKEVDGNYDPFINTTLDFSPLLESLVGYDAIKPMVK
jgi:hypothetical protein